MNLQLENTHPTQADKSDSDLDMEVEGFESDPGHRCTVQY